MRALLEAASMQDAQSREFEAWSNGVIAEFAVKPYDTLRAFTVERFDYPEGRGHDFRLNPSASAAVETVSLAQHAWRGTGAGGAPGQGLCCAAFASIQYVRAQMHSVLWLSARRGVYLAFNPDAAAKFAEDVVAVDWHDAEAVINSNFQPFSLVGVDESLADNLYNWLLTIDIPEVVLPDYSQRFPGLQFQLPAVEEVMSGAALLALDASLSSADPKRSMGLASLAANAMWQSGFQSGWEGRDDVLRDGAKNAGKKGGELRHQASRALKEWALREATSMRGADIDIARLLVQRIPLEHREASADPARLIYQALREVRKEKRQGG